MYSRRITASALSAIILRCGLHYGRIFGVIDFGVQRTDRGLLAPKREGFKCFCILFRVVLVGLYLYYAYSMHLSDFYLELLSSIHIVGCLTCTVFILLLQFWYGERVLRIVNSFLRLFRRVRTLTATSAKTSGSYNGYGCTREFVLLLLKAVSICYEVGCQFPLMWASHTVHEFLGTFCNMYVTIGSLIVMHIGFVGYLSVGALYSEINSYVRHELCHKLRSLERLGGNRPSSRRLRSVGNRLDECIGIYDAIQRLGSSFHKFYELPLCLSMLFHFLTMILVSYEVILRSKFRSFTLLFLVIKLFVDAALITLAAHGAVSSSRLVRRIGVENCYVSEDNEWHMKMELFLNRLNIYEFRVRPLGLFELSNELILVFLSAMVTYHTYIIQFGLQSHQI
ncbi:putative gustatory receptor 93c [Scaptodrosophila lebanonensis]|uniref:Gustatory receptor n=1 Tax=Drosophila lebanonensis TaxID=7225 RepID=A0A6J2T3U1_DROLE|nr:putative gustatory receptor 93c [Scaptodrosophila lebanonensis]